MCRWWSTGCPHKVLSLGVIDGRNIWKTDLNGLLEWLTPVHDKLGDRLWLAPSCSLIHVPVDLALESDLDPEIRSWLAFATQKLDELRVLKSALNEGTDAVAGPLADNARAIASRRASGRVNNPDIRQQVQAITPELGQRKSPYSIRANKQAQHLKLPRYPTTTIGSFPQTTDIRKSRLAYRKQEISREHYVTTMKTEIERAIREQEKLGLDVLVHGEAERNDMVEYFGEQLEGYIFTRFGWVQSYGSRCVKPPILYGDIHRPGPMTVEWIAYARFPLRTSPSKACLPARSPSSTGPLCGTTSPGVTPPSSWPWPSARKCWTWRPPASTSSRLTRPPCGRPAPAPVTVAGLPGLGYRCVPHHRQRREGHYPDPHPYVLFGVQRHY